MDLQIGFLTKPVTDWRDRQYAFTLCEKDYHEEEKEDFKELFNKAYSQASINAMDRYTKIYLKDRHPTTGEQLDTE